PGLDAPPRERGPALGRPARADRRCRALARVERRERGRGAAGGARRPLERGAARGHGPCRAARRGGRAARAARLAGARRAGRGDRDRAHVRQRRLRRVRERRAGPRRAPAAAGGVLMLHAVLSDVHANLEALEVVLADVERRGARDRICLGDFVGYGASPNECMSMLCPQIDAAVRPKGVEAFNPDAARAARWTARALSVEHRDYLIQLPLWVTWRGARLVHASPSDPASWSYVFRPGEAVREMASCTEALCLVGHSHVPGTFELRGTRATYTRT